MRPVDADALKEIIKERRTNIEKKHGIEVGFAIGMLLACEAIIDKQPTIEAKTIVHARWKLDSPIDWYHCSNCGEGALRDYFEYEVRSKYCPFCGAQMDEPFPQAQENDGCCKNCTDHIAEAGKKENDNV